MPQPRKYASAAERQAAFRDRRAAAWKTQMQAKGLPALPPITTMPGTARWHGAIRTAHGLLTTVCHEMQTYADERSEPWQESERAQEFADRLTSIVEIPDALEDYC
jgi:hypothetical protein